jgi:hypothetical protein
VLVVPAYIVQRLIVNGVAPVASSAGVAPQKANHARMQPLLLLILKKH